jgi:uncharacterized membrane protein YhhN
MAAMATLTVSLRWWVRPYVWLATMAWSTVGPFVDEEHQDRFVSGHAAFVAAHGLKITFGEP